jgi:hypothetical protein
MVALSVPAMLLLVLGKFGVGKTGETGKNAVEKATYVPT